MLETRFENLEQSKKIKDALREYPPVGNLTIHWFNLKEGKLEHLKHENVDISESARIIKEDLKLNRPAQYTWYPKNPRKGEQNGND